MDPLIALKILLRELGGILMKESFMSKLGHAFKMALTLGEIRCYMKSDAQRLTRKVPLQKNFSCE